MPPDICSDPIHSFDLPLNQSELGQELARMCLTTRDKCAQHQVLMCDTPAVYDAPQRVGTWEGQKSVWK